MCLVVCFLLLFFPDLCVRLFALFCFMCCAFFCDFIVGGRFPVLVCCLLGVRVVIVFFLFCVLCYVCLFVCSLLCFLCLY